MAPPVPIVYQLAKSVGHSTMAIYEIVSPYLSNPKANQLWRAPLAMYRTQNQTALDGLGALDISEDDRSVLRTILQRNLAFMDECLAKGTYTYEEFEKYIRGTTPHSVKTIGIGSGAQVGHWMKVVEDWKKQLGKDWERTYGVSNSLYIARQNNILFSVLVQFMGTETMGDRLLLDRDAGIRDDAGEDARRARAHRRRPRAGHGLLPRLLPDGRRTARRRRPGGDRAGDGQTRAEGLAADAGAVPLQRLAVENRPDQGDRPGAAGGCDLRVPSPPIAERPKLFRRLIAGLVAARINGILRRPRNDQF